MMYIPYSYFTAEDYCPEINQPQGPVICTEVSADCQTYNICETDSTLSGCSNYYECNRSGPEPAVTRTFKCSENEVYVNEYSSCMALPANASLASEFFLGSEHILSYL